MIAWRSVVAAGMLTIITVVVMIAAVAGDDLLEELRITPRWVSSSDVGNYDIEFYKGGGYRMREKNKGKYLTHKIDYVFDNNGRDTLTVFRHNGKRGYLNNYTGKIEIEAQYDKAWYFSEGLGGVVKDGKLGFINRSGELVIPYTFHYDSRWQYEVDYLFKGGYCTAVGENLKHGVIDTNANWVVEPQYDYINKPIHGHRIVKLGDKYGLMDRDLNLLLPVEYDNISPLKDGVVVMRDNMQCKLAYDGRTVLNSFVIDNSCLLTYYTGVTDEYDHSVDRPTQYAAYKMHNRYGLMSITTGKIITKQEAFFCLVKSEVWTF